MRAISRLLVSWILLDPLTELLFLPLMKLKISIATFKAKAVLFEILLNISLENFPSKPYSEIEILFIRPIPTDRFPKMKILRLRKLRKRAYFLSFKLLKTQKLRN